ncbi:hypothetical protein [Ilumatobacter coccineus]|jgi:hypothetical protein|uniref:YokE-like PH domain-containing protein n=1 Tax=Ilumatobacter coccineus (strain NBRC 103263 / KCTC 29153 / YM16-304) TaxID=1313172 RepID=A0A6C7DZ52_ILUCY|nr:hypothetical protein [Ilumatobacter coccineus]BAN00497.1 hypothetical protein YM304_01830 [Ilumatobacter coccineus YM16-304]
MIDLIKKVTKKAGHDLEPGEQVLDARIIQPAGQALRQAVAAGAFAQLGSTAKVVMDRRTAKFTNEQRAELEAAGGMAADFPSAKCYFTLTDRRVLVHSFGVLAGAPKDLLVTYPLTDFAGIEAQKGKLIGKMTLYMADGSSVPLDIFKGGGDPAELVQRFNDAIARAAASL